MKSVQKQADSCGGTNRRPRGEVGVTLVELVIAIAIAIIIGIFLSRIVNDQNKIFKRQDTITRLQQNARFSMEFIARSIESVGYGTNGTSVGTVTVPAISIENGGLASDQIQILFADPTDVAIMPWGETQPCTTSVIPLTSPPGLTAAAWYFKDANYMLCYSYSDSAQMDSFLFAVDSVDSGTNEVTITNPSGGTDFDSACTGNLPPNLMCSPAQWMTFYIDNTDGDSGPGTPGNPTLMMREATSPLTAAVTPDSGDFLMAEGIEYLDFEFCLDGAPGDCSESGDWVTTFTDAEAGSVRQVRITIWAKSDKLSDSRTLYSPPDGSAADGVFRVATTSTILIRNLRRLDDYN